MTIHNFSAGPSILPKEVLNKAAEAVIDFDQTGLSILEMSHRTAPFERVMDQAESLVRELLSVPSDYAVLFLHGGASLQFTMLVQNLLPVNGKAAYINTGVWSKKAIREAKLYGEVEVIASSEDRDFSYIPKDFEIPSEASFLHFTSNNTIYGTQFKSFPKATVPLVVDMSSDIFSRKIDVSQFDMIYAGAQKNMGPAGVALVIVKKDVLGRTSRTIPSMLSYQTHIENGSMFNTPPCFSIYVSMLNLQWLKDFGGVEAIQKRNETKAALLYSEIDANPLFKGTCVYEDRSVMTPTFVMKDKSKEAAFLQFGTERGLSGIKGHRSVGGFRASMYNAMPIESVEALVQAMRDFQENL